MAREAEGPSDMLDLLSDWARLDPDFCEVEDTSRWGRAVNFGGRTYIRQTPNAVAHYGEDPNFPNYVTSRQFRRILLGVLIESIEARPHWGWDVGNIFTPGSGDTSVVDGHEGRVFVTRKGFLDEDTEVYEMGGESAAHALLGAYVRALKARNGEPEPVAPAVTADDLRF